MFEMFEDDTHPKIVKRRSCRKLTLAQKVRVIQQYEHKISLRRLAMKFKCGRTQIKGILRNRNEHLQMWEEYSKQKKEGLIPSKSAPVAPVEVVLAEWVKRARCYEINLTDDILRNFAQEIANHLGRQEFKPTNEWTNEFKQKHYMYFAKVKEEKNLKDNKKPLSISVIINDLREEQGLDFIQEQKKPVKTYKAKLKAKTDNESQPAKKVTPLKVSLKNEVKKITPLKISLKKEADSAVPMEIDTGRARNGHGVSQATKPQVIKKIESYTEALNYLGPLEQFALYHENIRAVGLINQLENLFREELEKTGM